MSRQSHSSAPPSDMPKVVAAAALGAVLGTRSRPAGALILAGLAWMATRRTGDVVAEGATSKESKPAPNSEVKPSVRFSQDEPLDDIFPPFSPFIEAEIAEASWDELRAALAPPATLWPAAPPQSEDLPEPVPLPLEMYRPPSSPLLQSAPVFFKVDDPAPNAPEPEIENSVLPDTISIPNTPDPPPALLAASDQHSPPVKFTPAITPKAGLECKLREPFGVPYVPPVETPPRRKKGFFDWLRE